MSRVDAKPVCDACGIPFHETENPPCPLEDFHIVVCEDCKADILRELDRCFHTDDHATEETAHLAGFTC